MPLPRIDTKKFTQICNDWLALFPEYKKHGKGIFSKIVGPFGFSVFLNLFSGKEKYRVFSCISPLLIETDIMGAFLQTEAIRHGRIGWQGHTILGLVPKGLEELRDKTPFPLEGSVTVSQILKAYETHSDQEGFFIKNAEAPALLCGWCGKPEQAAPWIDWGREKYLTSHRENLAYKKSIKGTSEDGNYTVKTTFKDIDDWTEGMHRRVQDTDYLRDLVERQIKKFKYDKVPRYDLIIDI